MRSSMHFIGIAGPSCAGKGCLSRYLADRLPARILPLDAYYRPLDDLTLEQRSAVNYDEPSALDEALLESHLHTLLKGKAVDRPVYDFSQHNRSSETERLEPGEHLLIEGLFTLHWPSIRRMLAASIYITAPDSTCLDRRITRDGQERGRAEPSVRDQYSITVQPMRQLYVEPTRQYADLVLDGARPIAENGEKALEFLRALAPVSAAAG